MKKRGRKKKILKDEIETNQLQSNDQDGPVLDLEKSIIKKLIKQGKKDGYLTHEFIKKAFPGAIINKYSTTLPDNYSEYL